MAKRQVAKKSNKRISDLSRLEVPQLYEWIRERIRYWQRVLRLQDWEVDFDINRFYEMNIANRAEVHWDLNHKMARIDIRPPADVVPSSRKYTKYDAIIVHELLHLHFAPLDKWPKGSTENILLEQAIEAIAQALADRHGRER